MSAQQVSVQEAWACRNVQIRFQLSDMTLFTRNIRLQVREADAASGNPPEQDPCVPADPPAPGAEGFLIRSLPVAAPLPVLSRMGPFFRYVPAQFARRFIDMRQSFDDYKKQFSSKTRSTLQRKVRKFAEHSGGAIDWRVYRRPDEMEEFFILAREVSAKTYQERLLDAGLPDSADYRRELVALAGRDSVRAFILFDRGVPVSYLCCPVAGDVLQYQYLGYDPKYTPFSVGTVLQWLALEHLFGENRFRLFDFTEGDSDHKRLFATHGVQCANVFFIRASLRNIILLQGQRGMDRLSGSAGELLERMGVKARVKRLIRSGAA